MIRDILLDIPNRLLGFLACRLGRRWTSATGAQRPNPWTVRSRVQSNAPFGAAFAPIRLLLPVHPRRKRRAKLDFLHVTPN